MTVGRLGLFSVSLTRAHWGDVPTWAAAVGTIGAFTVSLALLARQIADRRRETVERRTSQARLVSAWISELRLPEGGSPAIVLLLRNPSEQPIYEVQLRVPVGVRGTFVRWLSPGRDNCVLTTRERVSCGPGPAH